MNAADFYVSKNRLKICLFFVVQFSPRDISRKGENHDRTRDAAFPANDPCAGNDFVSGDCPRSGADLCQRHRVRTRARGF